MKSYFISIFFLVSCCQVLYSQDFEEIEVIFRNDSTEQYLLAKNNLPTSITLKLKSNLQEVNTENFIIRSYDSIYLKRKQFSSKEEYLDYFKKNYSITYHVGDSISSKPDLDYLYQLPIQRNKKYQVIQSWGGKFSHSSKASYHAVDIKMEIGEPVHAARGGIVVRSVEKFTENGGKELENMANVIVVMHEDNTFAYYVHLMHEGSLVEIGQKVEQGEIIGYSGNVGFSTTPHLHFVVRDGTSNSIPVYFLNQKNKTPLKSGKTYKRKK